MDVFWFLREQLHIRGSDQTRTTLLVEVDCVLRRRRRDVQPRGAATPRRFTGLFKQPRPESVAAMIASNVHHLELQEIAALASPDGIKNRNACYLLTFECREELTAAVVALV